MTSLGLNEFTPTISFYDWFLAISLEIAVWIRFILGMLVNHRFTQDWLMFIQIQSKFDRFIKEISLS